MFNIKISIHIAITCLASLLYASIVSAENAQQAAECAQQAILGTNLPPCKPAANAPCYVVGGNSEICASEPANRLAVDEWRPEYECYSKYGSCERDDNGQCGWIINDELSQCIANMRSGTQESITPCTLCSDILQTSCCP